MKISFFDIEGWREIGVTLARNKTRTFLTAFGIFWGTAMLAMLLGGADGLERMLRKNFEGFATNSAVAFANRRTISYQGFNKGSEWEMTAGDVAAMRLIPGIDAVAPTNSASSVPVSSGKYNTISEVQGVDHEFVRVFLPNIREGRFINNSDQMNRRKVAVLGTQVADKLFPQGDAVGQYVNLGGIYYKVVGVAYQESEISINGSKVDEQINIPLSTLCQQFNLGDGIAGVMITALDGHTPKELKPRLFRTVRANHPIDPNDDQAMFFFDVSEQFAMVDSLFTGITFLAFFVGLGTLVAGIIGVGNIMWVIVKERTTEIGIRRAIGAKPVDIVMQIMMEGIVLTLTAGVAGISFASAVLWLAEKMANEKFQMSLATAAGIVAVFMFLGIAASIIPSLKAMKIKPIEAINDK